MFSLFCLCKENIASRQASFFSSFSFSCAKGWSSEESRRRQERREGDTKKRARREQTEKEGETKRKEEFDDEDEWDWHKKGLVYPKTSPTRGLRKSFILLPSTTATHVHTYIQIRFSKIVWFSLSPCFFQEIATTVIFLRGTRRMMFLNWFLVEETSTFPKMTLAMACSLVHLAWRKRQKRHMRKNSFLGV